MSQQELMRRCDCVLPTLSQSNLISLIQLPIENITSILSYITFFELIPLAQICKYFHSIILPFDDALDPNYVGGDDNQNDYAVWRYVAYCHYEKPFVDLGRKKKRVNRLSNCFTLKCNVENVKKVRNIIEKTAPFWHNLVIDFDGNYCLTTDFMYLLYMRKEYSSFTNLKIITVNHVDTACINVLSKILALCPSIEELILNETCILESEMETIKKKTFKTLKKLTIKCTENMLRSPEKVFADPTDNHFKWYQKLEEIHISGFIYDTPDLADVKRSSLFESKLLKKFVIERSHLGVHWFLSITPNNMVYLEMRECVALNASFVDNIIPKMKNLKTLIIDTVKNRFPSSEDRPSLEVFDSLITDNQLNRILTELVYLEFLDITCDMSQVCGTFLQTIRNIQHLNYLALESTCAMHMIDYLQENKVIHPIRNTSVQHLFLYGDERFSDIEMCEQLILPFFSEDIETCCFGEIPPKRKRAGHLTLASQKQIYYEQDTDY